MNAMSDKPLAEPADSQSAAPASSQPRRRLLRLWRPAAALAAVIGIGVTASWWFTEGRYIESTDNAYVQGDIAVLSPRIEGDVAAIKVADNQHVHAGDPLIELDPADWQARLAQATAAAAEADCRGRDGAAAGRAAAGDDRGRAGRDGPGAGRASPDQRRRETIGHVDGQRLGVAPGQRPGGRRFPQGRCIA